MLEIDPSDIRRPSKKRIFARARGIVCYLAVAKFRYKGEELGRQLRLTRPGVSRAVRRGEKVLRENPDLKAKLSAIS